MSKTTMIVDYNNLAMRAMFTCKYIGTENVGNFDSQEDCNVLVRKIATDLSSILRFFSPERVILVCDARNPWRNDVYKDIADMEYKGNREKDEEKNWENIYNSMEEFSNILIMKGIVVTSIERSEADDLAALWTINELDNKRNVILVSTDKDWSQLVSFNGKNFCIVYNPLVHKNGKRKLYGTQAFIDWLNYEDPADIFFSNYDESKKKLKDSLSSASNLLLEPIDPFNVLLEKIMCGDSGDNVPAFYDYYKSGKKMRVTPLKCNHIKERLGIESVNDLKNAVINETLKSELEREMKIGGGIDLDFDERLKRQRLLVELNPDLFPKSIVNRFNSHRDLVFESGYVNSREMNANSLLEGTKFLDKNYHKPKENSIFDDIKLLGRFSKTPNLF